MTKTRKSKYHTRAIVTGYLEKVSAEVFDRYQKEITDMTKGEQGIYALYRKNKLYYVGLATNLRNRIKHHLKDRHKDHWTHFSLYIIRKVDHIKELESLLLRIAYPEGNSQKGKLKTSENLLPTLLERVEEAQERERDIIFKGSRLPVIGEHNKQARKKTQGKADDKPLRGYFPGGKRLYASWKGKDYKAWVFASGTIKFKGRLYDTPTGAAKVINGGKAINGWWLWRIKDDEGQLVRLKALRKR
jgi:hypothetical protein